MVQVPHANSILWPILCRTIDSPFATSGYYYEDGDGVLKRSTSGNITIFDGTIRAEGGTHAAAIGSGYKGACGEIFVSENVIRVEVKRGSEDADYIGKGSGGTCGWVSYPSWLTTYLN